VLNVCLHTVFIRGIERKSVLHFCIMIRILVKMMLKIICYYDLMQS